MIFISFKNNENFGFGLRCLAQIWGALLLLVPLCAAAPGPLKYIDQIQFAMHCEQNLVSYSLDRFNEALVETPGLLQLILKMMDDPLVPREIKKIVKAGLQPDGVTKIGKIRNLTQVLRETWGVQQNTHAFYVVINVPYGRFKNAMSGGLQNEIMLQNAHFDLNNEFGAYQGIGVSDRPASEAVNDLIFLVHELAHWHFEAFLVRHLPHMVKRLPRGMVYQNAEGVYFINSAFRDFLHERYAKELEYKTLLVTHGRPGYSPYWSSHFSMELKESAPSKVMESLTYNVLKIYNIKDVYVSAIATLPLSKIMLGFAPAAFDVEQVRNFLGSLYDTPDENEFKVLFYFAYKGLLRDGKIKPFASGIEYHDAIVSIIRILVVSKDHQNFITFVNALVRKLSALPGGLEDLLDLINTPFVRRILVEQGHWQISADGAPLTADDLLAVKASL